MTTGMAIGMAIGSMMGIPILYGLSWLKKWFSKFEWQLF